MFMPNCRYVVDACSCHTVGVLVTQLHAKFKDLDNAWLRQSLGMLIVPILFMLKIYTKKFT